MIDFAAARRMMVDGQVRPADVTDPGLIAAMFELPRERFVPERVKSLAYLDLDLPVSENGDAASRRLLKPMVLAKLLQAAEVVDTDRVLDVGCATGYSSAVLARLAGSVVALEEDAALAHRASELLAELGAVNAKVVTGSLLAGVAADGRYDVIVLEGSTEIMPTALLNQLKDGGQLIGVFGRGPTGKAMIYRSIEGDLSGRAIFDATAPLLPGFIRPAAFVF